MIHRLELENYIPLLGSGITKVIMTLGEVINLLVSVNGVGKSQILKQLNPLPAENSDFVNGRKYIEILLNGKLYKLESVTGKEGYHSFKIDDGEELNPGGLITVQKKLVQQHFNCNTNIVNVLNGIKAPDLISNMTPNRRKEVFMELYPNEVTYAMGVYNKLKAERNGLNGAIKNQLKHHTEERAKLERITETCTAEGLEPLISSLETEIKEGLVISGALSKHTLNPELDNKVNQLKQLTTKLISSGFNTSYLTKGQLANELVRKERNLKVARGEYDKLLARLSEVKTQITNIGLNETVSKEQLEEHLVSLMKDLEYVDGLHKSYSQKLTDTYVLNELDPKLYSITDELITYLRRVVPASRTGLTGIVYKEWMANKATLEADVVNKEAELTRVNHQIDHINKAESLECPDCKHTFKVGIRPEDLPTLTAHQERLIKQIENTNSKLKTVTNDLELEEDWYFGMQQLMGYIRQNQQVKNLVDLVKRYKVGEHDANLGRDTLIEALVRHQETFKLNTRLTGLTEEINSLENRIKVVTNNDVDSLKARAKFLETDLDFWSKGIDLTKRDIDDLEYQIESINKHEQLLAVLHNLVDEINSAMSDKQHYLVKLELDRYLKAKNEEKTRLMKDLIELSSLRGVVENIESNLDQLKHRYLIVDTLMKGLCPNKGLIGKLMSDFISTVCGNMNAIIKEVWNTPLFVKPCSKDNGDLTYKFPVVIGDGETKDISDCSDGQCDIINFVFRKVMLRYHGDWFPLFMDEIGVKFDEINRGRFFNYINDYVNSGSCNQLFMVSHYVNQYESFKNANLIGLRYDGLTINGKVNRNTVVE